MFSKSRRSSNRKRSHQNRFSKQCSIESLEARQMFAADLFADAGQVLSMQVESNSPPAAVASMSSTTGNGPVADFGQNTTNAVFGGVIDATTGTFVDVPLPPPELGAKFENGVLTITGSHDADNLFISASDGMLSVREVPKELTLLSVPLAEVMRIVVNANGGDDWVSVDESINIPATLRGDWGNDTLQGGAAGDDLFGGSGDDELVGRGGNDLLRGEHGNDLLIGGDGNDVIYGGFGNDYLLGGDGNDWLMGDEGDDQMFGEAGNDLMFGGSGQNLMDGGDGDDQMYGGEDIDAMYGGEGDDFIRGFGGDDRIRGEGGNDYIIADDGDDIVDGGDGDDQIAGDNGNDALVGGNGNDVIAGGNGQDWISGEGGNDVLNGGAGNDFLMGRSGNDQLDGGSGNNSVHQNQPDGYVQYGTTTQSLSWGDVGDFIGDVWDGIVDVFNWTLDKIETIGTRVYDWATHIDDRLFRFGSDLAGALSNWPWEADFWKGLGRSLVDALEVVGLGEAWEIAFEILKPWQRGMTSEEIAVARSVFGNSIPYDRVRLDEHSLMAKIGRTHVTGFIINSTENISDSTMIHELTHVWQYVKDGLVYIPEAIAGQSGDDGYDYGDVAGLQAKIAAGQGLTSFNPEQQGAIVADYFDLRNDAREYEARGEFAPLSMRQELDVYIHFVKEVTTLTPEQLDTPNPVIHVGPIVGDIGPIYPASKPVLPTTVPRDSNGDLVVNSADYEALRGSLGRRVTSFTVADDVVDAADRQWRVAPKSRP